VVVVSYALYKSPGGCEGNCNQGRSKCDCKRMYD